MNSIEVEGLQKSYKQAGAVLSGVSFGVEPGRIFGLLGRNGAGKSTTVRILSTLTLPTEGSARVAGFDVVSQPADVRRRIGVTMQEAALDEYSSAREHLLLMARLWGLAPREAAARVEDLLGRFGLEQAADRRVGAYSGGMRRRVDIATALLNRPDVLFLDEPTTGLDPQSRRALWREIRQLRDQGAAVLLTTQYLEEAEELADTVGVLDGGRLVAVDSPGELVGSVSRTVVELNADDPAAVHRVAGAAGAAARSVNGTGAVRIDLPADGGGTDAVSLLSAIEQQGVEVGGVKVTQPSLEDAYLRLTGSSIEHGATYEITV